MVENSLRNVNMNILGRQALPRSVGASRTSITPSTTTTTTTTTATNPSISTIADTARQASSSSTATTNSCIIPSDRSQQQIIEFIRSRDVQGFITHIEQGNIDVNYTDNVGQTMLNWVAAFGTREMIEYLCRRGADVNRGQRSSSLHYAACFGRPSIVRLLLKYGGNVDLRDEDGRTALDKARERQDEGHQEVVDILQSAHEWTDIRRQDTTTTITQSNPNSPTTNTEQILIITPEIKGDIEMQPIYLQRLLSTFCQLYQNTMILTIKRSTLRLISKLLHYATVEQIREYLMSDEINILTILFELLSSILDTNEDDDDTSNLVLLIIKNLFEKDRHLFLEQFQYLGLIWKITSLALSHPITPSPPPPSSIITNINSDQQQSLLSINILAIDAKEILCHRPYVWNEFNFLRNRECLYLWNGSIAIELSMGSNGWFRFFADNALSTMYSSG
jgi:E3 ubiquitin-protein ligase HECTD1